ncbi:PQQ-dependent sugar dehydrogenase [Halococcus saccharolyticus]|uniref:Blue (Type 1) copper domain-containing protein n=1 Tax=Halococcus saccharolyticus DSM 5350 TaxID=1227455 RepID=M0MNV3_9EURY|nr:PQQ-dependent sugar dehydrogenase [Halococcus saccharolyticus]EMA46120.1 blue (type 1) copper domain-containing protein [Halococcus saccharolyticus DSM 5350]
MTSPNRSAATSSRRRFLSLTAVGTFAGVGGLAGAEAQSQPEVIRLGGEVAGWQGRAPEPITGETNPTLDLEPETDYRVVWENLDGIGHNFALLDSEENVLERTEVMSEEGDTQSFEFTAREEMAEYVCEPHITSMQGSISFGGGAGEGTTRTTSEDDDSESFIPTGATVRVETVADGDLAAPLDFEIAAEQRDRQFVVDRAGQVYVNEPDGLREEPFVDVSDRLAEITGEMGLLGLAFHPDFDENRRFYLRYSAPRREDTPENFDHTEVLSAFRASEDLERGLPDSERTLLEIPSPYDTHNSGAITFGPDGYLYVGMGDGGGGHDRGIGHVADWYERFDGGSGPDVAGNGQDVTENLLGSILRIDVDGEEGDTPYAIPDDNPLVGEDGFDEQYAWGFRNPWRMGFSNGRLFVADVGQKGFEEVSVVESGGNYGWNVREGTHCFEPGPEGSKTPPEECPERTPPDVRGGEPLIDPVIEYPHSYEDRGVGSAVIGGYVYENDTIGSLEGKYVFGDYRKPVETDEPTGSLFAATPTDDGLWDLEELVVENTESGLLGSFVLAFGRDDAGDLYVLTTDDPGAENESGAVHRIRQSATSTQAPTTTTNTTNTPSEATGVNTSGGTSTMAVQTPRRTSAATTTTDAIATNTTSSETSDPGTDRTSTTAAGANTAEATAGTSGSSGPGFGVLAGLAGLAGVAVHRLMGRDDT